MKLASRDETGEVMKRRTRESAGLPHDLGNILLNRENGSRSSKEPLGRTEYLGVSVEHNATDSDIRDIRDRVIRHRGLSC
jgi:hypothetical protein